MYKPILNAIAAREKHIASLLAEATKKEAQAQKEQDDFKKKNEAFETQKEKLLKAAKAEVEDIRATLLKEATDEAESLRSQKKEALQNELDDLRTDILKQMKEQVFAISSKVLGDLADATLEERMIGVFISHLRALSDKNRAELSSDSAVITSAFALSQAQQKAIKSELSAKSLKFKVAPELMGGIELSANGHKLAWSISDYLETLEKEASHAA